MEKLIKAENKKGQKMRKGGDGSLEKVINKIFNKRVLFVLKIAITLIILWLIFRKIDLKEVYATAIQLKVNLLVLLIIISLVKFMTQLKNWECCLRITTNYQPPRYEILKSHLIGQALRFIIPGGHAAFGKVYFVSNKKRSTLFSIGIERFMQTWTNLWFASWAGLFYFRQYSLWLRWSMVLIITLIPVILYWSSRILKRGDWKEFFNQYIRIVPSITIRQLLFVFLTVLQYLLIINRYQSLKFIIGLISVPLILVANIIPITYAGLGLRETFAIHVFKDFNIQPEVAVTASLIIFFINSVLPAMIGAVLMITEKRKS